MKRTIPALLACLWLYQPQIALAQGVPNSATVVSSCGTPLTTYTPGQNQPLLQDTNGRSCINTSNGAAPATIVRVPSALASAGIAPVSTAVVASNLVAKGSGGNIQNITVTADSTLSAGVWYIMVFNATALPSNGTVTPAFVFGVPSGTVTFQKDFNIPAYLGTGITIGVSTTGPYSLTASAHAAITALVQ